MLTDYECMIVFADAEVRFGGHARGVNVDLIRATAINKQGRET
jgi:hypothetical protein